MIIANIMMAGLVLMIVSVMLERFTKRNTRRISTNTEERPFFSS